MLGIFGKKNFDIQIQQTKDKKLGYFDVRLKIKACGVCGTDIHYLGSADKYTPLGHEIAAEVVEMGKGINDIGLKDRVIVEDVSYCGVCDKCKNGQISLCKSGPTLAGQSGMSDYIVVDRRMVVPFDGLADETACLTEPLAVALNAFLATGITSGESVVIFGMGAIGLLCAAVAKRYGAQKVIVVGHKNLTENDRYRKAVALRNGADHVLFSEEEDLTDQIEYICNGKTDAVIITSPPKTLSSALSVLKYGGTAVPIGIDLGGAHRCDIDVNALIFNKHLIKPMLAEPALRFPMSLSLLREHIIHAEDFVTHTFGFETAESVLKKYKQKKEHILKAVFINE